MLSFKETSAPNYRGIIPLRMKNACKNILQNTFVSHIPPSYITYITVNSQIIYKIFYMCEYLRNGKNKIRNKWSVYN